MFKINLNQSKYKTYDKPTYIGRIPEPKNGKGSGINKLQASLKDDTARNGNLAIHRNFKTT